MHLALRGNSEQGVYEASNDEALSKWVKIYLSQLRDEEVNLRDEEVNLGVKLEIIDKSIILNIKQNSDLFETSLDDIAEAEIIIDEHVTRKRKDIP